MCKKCDASWYAKHLVGTRLQKKWYGFACSALYGWVTKNDVHEACEWVCGACKERSITATEVWPDIVASSASQAAAGTASNAASAASHNWSQDDTPIEDLVLVCSCTTSSYFPESSPLYQAPLQRSQLVDMYGAGIFLLEKHGGAVNLDLVQKRPPLHVKHVKTGLRAENDADWHK